MDQSDLCNACGHVHGVGTTCPICGHIRTVNSNNVIYQPTETISSTSRVGDALGRSGYNSLSKLNTVSRQPIIPWDSFQRMHSDFFTGKPTMNFEKFIERCDELYLSRTEAQRKAIYPLIIQAYRNNEFPFNPDPDGPNRNNPNKNGGMNAIYFRTYWARGGEDYKPSAMLDNLIDAQAFEATDINKMQYYITLYKVLMVPQPTVGGKRNTKRRRTNMRRTRRTTKMRRTRKIRKTRK